MKSSLLFISAILFSFCVACQDGNRKNDDQEDMNDYPELGNKPEDTIATPLLNKQEIDSQGISDHSYDIIIDKDNPPPEKDVIDELINDEQDPNNRIIKHRVENQAKLDSIKAAKTKNKFKPKSK